MSTSRRDEIQRVVDTILRPLLEVDGGGIDVVELASDGSSIELALTGALRGDPSASLLKERVIEPALRKAAAGPLAIKYVHAAR
jgi:Fe-S cluster biogenesis protein NfuA